VTSTATHEEQRAGSARDQLEGYSNGVSFAHDIRPLFRDSPDVDSMKDYGIDLSSYEQVKEKAPEIYARLKDGSMPCDEPWPNDEVTLFKSWMDEGMAP
jgi:hypothetical protein